MPKHEGAVRCLQERREVLLGFRMRQHPLYPACILMSVVRFLFGHLKTPGCPSSEPLCLPTTGTFCIVKIGHRQVDGTS